jgi:hypothetical protein
LKDLITAVERERLSEKLSDAIVLHLSDVPNLLWSSPLMKALQRLTEDSECATLYNDHPKLMTQTDFSTQLYLQMLWSRWSTGGQKPSEAFRKTFKQTVNIILKAFSDANSEISLTVAIKAVKNYETVFGIDKEDLSRMFKTSLLIVGERPNGEFNIQENLLLTSLLLKLAQRSGFSRLKILSICLDGAKINSRTAGWTRYAIPLLRDLPLGDQAEKDSELLSESLKQNLVNAMVAFWNEIMKDPLFKSRTEEATILFSTLTVLDDPASLAKKILEQIKTINPQLKFDQLNSAFKHPDQCLSSHHLYSSVLNLNNVL